MSCCVCQPLGTRLSLLGERRPSDLQVLEGSELGVQDLLQGQKAHMAW